MGSESHGQDPTVIHSSIALLQERFRQLQRVKEMREERELLRMLTSEPKHQFISNSKSSMTTANCEPPPTTTMSFPYPDLTTISSARPPQSPPPPPPQNHVSLSLWPPWSSSSQEPLRETLSSVVAFLEPETPPRSVSMTLWKKNAYDFGGSASVSGVDTSLHL